MKPGDTVVVVGDGAVGLCGVLAAAQMGAERVVAMSRHEPRQEIARQFGATHIVAERGKAGAERRQGVHRRRRCRRRARVRRHRRLDAAGLRVARPGSTVGFVGVPHGVELPVRRMFARTSGWPEAWRRCASYLPSCSTWSPAGAVDPGLVFDSQLPLDEVAEGYRAMDERRAIKVYLDV